MCLTPANDTHTQAYAGVRVQNKIRAAEMSSDHARVFAATSPSLFSVTPWSRSLCHCPDCPDCSLLSHWRQKRAGMCYICSHYVVSWMVKQTSEFGTRDSHSLSLTHARTQICFPSDCTDVLTGKKVVESLQFPRSSPGGALPLSLPPSRRRCVLHLQRRAVDK